MLHEVITRFGLPAIFLGSGIEGEPFAIAGGLLAHRGTLPLGIALLAAMSGALGIDLFWFTLGRRFRAHRWVQAATRRPAFAKSHKRIESHPVLAIFLFRFAYGLRAIAPVAVGVSRISALRFVSISLISAATWGSIFTMLGYWCGAAVDPWAEDIAVFGCAIGLAVLLFGFLRTEQSGA